MKKTTTKLEFAARSLKYPLTIKVFGDHIPVFDQMKYCQKCGLSNHRTARFCQRCSEEFTLV